MHPYRRIPGWLFWPLVLIALALWLALIGWLVFYFFGGNQIKTTTSEVPSISGNVSLGG